MRDAIATEMWKHWEENSSVSWNDEKGEYEQTGQKVAREDAEKEWYRLKASWLANYPFDAEYEVQFIMGYEDSPEAVFAPIKEVAAKSGIKTTEFPESWVSDYLTVPPQ
jgi:hypothetical protein